ncbi:hypothetical protein SKAU_G00154750 [Synaphobranchus kaupii]|uniref:Uncharacterized protein n=1 Tax=Synaphobranchus kaupii TaxID=118154 RepID=A0A9Q1IZ58_SYNKA|nr:hypothetical protein SKAU_G00154750 [Synaphobranchus kaupii]
MVRRESLAPQAHMELLVPVVLLVTVVSPDPLGLLALLVLQVQMVSLEPRESRAQADRRVTLVPPALRVHQGPPDLQAPLVFLDPKVPVELRAHPAPPDSLELPVESDLQAPTVTLVLLDLRALLVKTVQRVSVETVVPPVGRETLGCVGQLEPQERREILERMAPPVCQGNVEREDSLAFRDLVVSLANKELLVEPETADPQALLAPLDSQDLLESLVERVTPDLMGPPEEMVPLESRAIAVTLVPTVPQEPPARPVPQVPSAPPANRATEERREHKDLQDLLGLLELEEWL